MKTTNRSAQTDQSTCIQWLLPPSHLQNLTAQFSPIDLQGIENAALLNRVDTKYLLTDDQLLNILATPQI